LTNFHGYVKFKSVPSNQAEAWWTEEPNTGEAEAERCEELKSRAQGRRKWKGGR